MSNAIMPSDDKFFLLYLLILLVGIGSFFFGDFRNRFSRIVQQAMVWVAIFAITTVVFANRDMLAAAFFPKTAVQQDGDTIILTRARDGHFYATLSINDVAVEFVVDTGATQVVLSKEDATRIGIDPDNLVFMGRANTANGQVRTARVRLDHVAFADRVDRNLPASVNGGELDTSLLGMSYLSRFRRIEIEGNSLRLVP